jgi:flagellar basal-body rod protein FlgC
MSLFSAISVSASGMAVQRMRAEVLTENLANAETTRTAEGGPYKRKDLVFQSQAQGSPFSAIMDAEMNGGPTGVTVSDMVVDNREPDRRYLPSHPDAGPDGYVAYPRINPAEEMVDLMGAQRGYEANVSAISAVKDMIQRSIDLLR